MRSSKKREFYAIIFAFAIGIYFAFLQFSYFFLLEIFFSTRVVVFFVMLFFWLIGFLVGLNQKFIKHFPALLGVSVSVYYVALIMNYWLPYTRQTFIISVIAITFSGIAPGYFFIYGERYFMKVKNLFIYENNGFMLGVTLALIIALFKGKSFLIFGPLWSIVCIVLSIKIAKLDKYSGKLSSVGDDDKSSHL